MFISSVGIFLFPLSMWEGTKFMAEKFISALIGFFIKLLFCSICIFLMMYGYLSLAKSFVDKPFMGLVDEILMILFVCILFYYICKSAPGLAQSLLTGAPSLTAAGAIGAAAGAIGAAASVAGLGARTALGVSGAVNRGVGAAQEASGKYGGAKSLSGVLAGVGGFAKGLGMAGFDAARTPVSDLTRSLVSKPLFGNGPGGGGAGGGVNRHSAAQMALKPTDDGYNKTFGEAMKEQRQLGADPHKNDAYPKQDKQAKNQQNEPLKVLKNDL
jgi:type IV secretory pathway TrbL component